MIPPESVKRKLNGVVDGIPPDEGYEILGGESTDDNGTVTRVKMKAR